jgi:hypothetical protein
MRKMSYASRHVVASLVVMLAATTSTACNKAKFGGGTAKKGGSGDVLPAGGMQNPENPPLDVGAINGNTGPSAGTGEVMDKTIELDCDNAEGVIIDVAPKGTEPLPPLDGAGKDDVDGKESATLALLGNSPVDVDGKPVGDPGKPGKPDGGKPDIPLPVEPPVAVPDDGKVVTKVKGAFCPQSRHALTVLLVVDYSGSMGRHVHDQGGPEVPGNDPQVNGSCGRLRAAQAILDRIMRDKAPGDTVNVGMVPFAGGIVTSKVIPLVDAAAFTAHVNKDEFCQYVVQDASFGYDPINPGGIDGGGSGFLGLGSVDSSTNYRAAFTAAQSMLSGVYGRKAVYFVSDGEPTSGGADPVQAGIEAGRALRANVDNLTLNGLLLGAMGPGAEQVLVEVAGSPDRVRRAESADELANEILNFPDASIDESTGRATLFVAPYPAANLGLRYLAKDPSRDGVWRYETQPFVLMGRPGETVLNLVEVTAQGSDGSTYRSIVKIRYRQ